MRNLTFFMLGIGLALAVLSAAAHDLLPMAVESQLQSHGEYRRARGDLVHSPAAADQQPPGAVARCADGAYSFSQSARGTCSRHGGVAEWVRPT